MSLFGEDVAVSLVDDSFIFSTRSASRTVALPAYVATQTGTGRVLTLGEEAKAMLGRAPENITVSRALVEGTIGDVEAAIELFRHGLQKMRGAGLCLVPRPRVVVAIRSGEVIKYAVKNVSLNGGAREIYLIDIGMATAIGMDLEVQKPEIHAVLSISDDWFEFSVTSLSNILTGTCGSIGTSTWVEDLQNHCTLARQFRPDAATLEASLFSGGIDPASAASVHGWEVWAGKSGQGQAMESSVSREDITTGIMPSLVRMTGRIKNAIRTLTAEQQYELSRTTIHGAGSAMAIPGLAQAISGQLGITVTPFSAALHPSIEGCRRALAELKYLRSLLTELPGKPAKWQ